MLSYSTIESFPPFISFAAFLHCDYTLGYELYSDVYDNPEQDHLIQWLQDNKDKCEDVDVVCTHQIIAKVYKAPYVEPSSLPWEIRVRRGPDGVCYLREE